MKASNSLITLSEVAANLAHRDLIDSTREVSPLRMAKDARILDNSNMSMDEQLFIAWEWAMERIQGTDTH
jgi:cytidylate kinase